MSSRGRKRKGRVSDYTDEDLKTEALQVLRSLHGATHLADLVRQMKENGNALSESRLNKRLGRILDELPVHFLGARWRR